MANAEIHWDRYDQACVLVDPDVEEKRLRKQNDDKERLRRFGERGDLYFGEMDIPAEDTNSKRLAVGSSLERWIVDSSWSYCARCFSVNTCNISPGFRRPHFSTLKTCQCSGNYTVPRIADWPQELKGLTSGDQSILAFFALHVNSTQRLQHGYRYKDRGVAVTLIQRSVLERIHSVEDEQRRSRLLTAYHYLVNDGRSAYGDFVRQREEGLLRSRIPFYNLFDISFIESAIWPILYPYKIFCESAISGGESTKRAYMYKILSNVCDYSTSFELLRFQYDRWLYKTVCGAIESGRVLNCSPARALDSKVFSETYWQWQHAYLADAVQQFGLPNIFITISPYEWTFPRCFWIQQRMNKTGKGATTLPTVETLHFAHIMSEILRGYVTGKNKYSWKNHLLANILEKSSNVLTYFYRFEFQKRGTVHCHFIAWMENAASIDVKRFQADLPEKDREFAKIVFATQKSNSPVHGLEINPQPSSLETHDGQTILRLHRSAAAHSLNLRIYADTIVTALKCSMDIQFSNQSAMLLNYVAGYVSKNQDFPIQLQELSRDVQGRDVAFQYLSKVSPTEPEMVLALSNIKFAHTPSPTKRVLLPRIGNVGQDHAIKMYQKRPQDASNLSFYEFLHEYTWDRQSVRPRCHSHIPILVGVKTLSLLNDEYFFQDSLLHCPFRKVEDLQPDYISTIPCDLKNFSFAVKNRRAFWCDEARVRNLSKFRGNRNYYTNTVASYVRSYWDLWHLWKRGEISSELLENPSNASITIPKLTVNQETFVSEALAHVYDKIHEEPFFLLCGPHGTGKTLCIKTVISRALQRDMRVCVATPTGMLSASYKSEFGKKIASNTVHSLFSIPVNKDQNYQTNWSLRHFDIIIVDEISMISRKHAMHIVATLTSARVSLVIFCGDRNQLQPVYNDEENIRGSLFDDVHLMSLCRRTTLVQQHRTQDVELQKFLAIIRHIKPNSTDVDHFVEGICLGTSYRPDEQEITDAYWSRTQSFLTFTNEAASYLNNTIVNCLFRSQTPEIYIKCTSASATPQPIYCGMKMMLTENRQKERGFVNGQIVTVVSAVGKTILVKVPQGKIIRVYPVTDKEKNTYYPLKPSYATTIHKVQGQTLEKICVWFDKPILPNGCAYVALSRVRRKEDIRFLTKPVPSQFKPYSMC